MREILFRGKRIDNGEWAVGYLGVFKDRTQIYVPFTEEEEKKYRGHIFSTIGGSWYTVDPSTVGQYTGLIDKNGVKIFEGDILLFESPKQIASWKAKVLFYMGEYILEGIDKLARLPLNDFASEAMEVIGNIHDNPELLENP